ncbi:MULTISPECIES: hypothetical protein [unclassified Methylibium]|nr:MULTISPECIES: hypothetical protein [unclassified Methylibium]
MSAAQEVIGLAVIEALRVELDDLRAAPLVIGVAAVAGLRLEPAW